MVAARWHSRLVVAKEASFEIGGFDWVSTACQAAEATQREERGDGEVTAAEMVAAEKKRVTSLEVARAALQTSLVLFPSMATPPK